MSPRFKNCYTLSPLENRSPFINRSSWISSSSSNRSPPMQMCGGMLVGGNGAGGIGRMSLLMPRKLPDRLPPLCKCLRLELKPEKEFNTFFVQLKLEICIQNRSVMMQ